MTNISTLFRLSTDIPARNKELIPEIKKMTGRLGSAARDGDFLTIVTNLLYDAHTVGGLGMIKSIFFPAYGAIKKVKERRKLIADELASVTSLESADASRQLRMLNLYRAVIADLFDPYISLIVACLQLKEGTFESFLQANLGQGERNKYEYAYSRLAPTTLFEGYNPVVRNALSHTGSESILQHQGQIVFKGIKRGNPPHPEIVKWTDEQLWKNLLALMDFIYAIEISVNIFGVDISDQIDAAPELQNDFVIQVLDTHDRLYIQEGFNELINAINSKAKSRKEAWDNISKIYFLECGKRSMPVSSLRFASADRTIVIDIPAAEYVSTDDSAIKSRLLEMIRYGIIAEPCFHHDFDSFVVTEPKGGPDNWLQIKLTRQDLHEYSQEKAGLVDLLHGCTSVLNGRPISFEVDFKQLDEVELLSFETIFPRRLRK